MTNSQLLCHAHRLTHEHALLRIPITPAFEQWLNRPCQLPLPFPSLGKQNLTRTLDMAMADWQHYQRTLTECCT